MQDVGIFLFGLTVTLIVLLACALIVVGIREERRDREELERATGRDLGLNADAPRSTTRADATTVPVGDTGGTVSGL